jgi:hypothetical protein
MNIRYWKDEHKVLKKWTSENFIKNELNSYLDEFVFQLSHQPDARAKLKV